MDTKEKMIAAFNKGKRTLFDKNGGLSVSSEFPNDVSMQLNRLPSGRRDGAKFEITLFEGGFGKAKIYLASQEAAPLIPVKEVDAVQEKFKQEQAQQEKEKANRADALLEFILMYC